MNSTISTPHVSQKWLDFWNRSPATVAVETSILILIGLIAIGGNLLVVISIYRNPSLRTITNYFVLSLAMTDILYPMLVLPVSVVSSAVSRFALGHTFCQIQVTSTLILLNVSCYTIAVMAVNRYVCVCKQHKYKRWFNKKTCLIMIFGGWFVYLVVGLVAIGTGEVVFIKFFPREIMCKLSRVTKTSTTKIAGNILVAFFILLPFTIITYCYFKVFKKIREHKRNIASASNPNSLGTSVQEIKVTLTMFTVLMGFVLNWIPILIVMLTTSHDKSLPRQVHMIVTYLMASCSAVNPVIYGAMNPTFRKEYKKIIKCQPH
ncbi:melatonin receptor type 1A-like [Actinia tenebrosa]|uniref:Melatonin receptor type 1A-like n=1 Tax=Actinia tenebrosa TaxID=6105 RepID=A0A6P8I1L3_ACTTE|nr:melatonin receptor type 1A-like [Actinia tenebrosa]